MAVVDYDGELFIYFDNSSEFTPSDAQTSFTDSMTFHSGTQFFIYDENNLEIDITNLVVNKIYEGVLEGCTFGFVWTDVAKQLYIFDTDGNDSAIIQYQNGKWVCSLNDTTVNALNIISVSNYDEQSLNEDLTPYIGTKISLVDEKPVLELVPFLTKIANAIRAKKGTTAQINAQDFASEIESIESGGSSGGATLKGGWTGTAVPTDGSFVENLYFNTQLSIEEVCSLIDSATAVDTDFSEEFPIVIVHSDTNEMYGLMRTGGIYGIVGLFTESYYFAYDITGAGQDVAQTGFSGWKSDFNGIIAVNQNTTLNENSRAAVNEVIKTLISITPIINKEPITLSGEYTPLVKEVNETFTITENGTQNITYSFTSDFDTNKEILTNVDVNVDVNVECPVATYVNENKVLSGNIKGGICKLHHSNNNYVYDMHNFLYDSEEMVNDDEYGKVYPTIKYLVVDRNSFHNGGTATISNISVVPAFTSEYCKLNNVHIKGDSITTIEQSGFYYRTNIRKVELPIIETIGDSAFHLSSIRSLIIGTNNCSLGQNVFSISPISEGFGYIYVPDDAVETYKTANRWSNYASQILPVSEIENGWHLVLEIGEDVGSGFKYQVNDGEFVEITSGSQTINLTNVNKIRIEPLNNDEYFDVYNSGFSYDNYSEKAIIGYYATTTIHLYYDNKLKIGKHQLDDGSFGGISWGFNIT